LCKTKREAPKRGFPSGNSRGGGDVKKVILISGGRGDVLNNPCLVPGSEKSEGNWRGGHTSLFEKTELLKDRRKEAERRHQHRKGGIPYAILGGAPQNQGPYAGGDEGKTRETESKGGGVGIDRAARMRLFEKKSRTRQKKDGAFSGR